MLKKLQKQLRPDNRENFKDLNSLQQTPRPETKIEMPTFMDFKKGYSAQADMLFMPMAKYGYYRILVVIDNHTKKFDAEPLKSTTSAAITKAMTKVFDRGIVTKPIMMQVDGGSEFKNEFQKYCDNNDIRIRTSPPDRHRSQGMVESKNRTFGKFLYSFINEKELQNLKDAEAKGKKKGAYSVDWYQSEKHFRYIIDFINENTKAKVYSTQPFDYPISDDYNKHLLPVGSLVRTQLEAPIDIAQSKKLHGDFRATDIRWNRQIRPIEWVSLNPSSPPMYKVEGEKIMRTRNQLQLMSKINSNHGFV